MRAQVEQPRSSGESQLVATDPPRRSQPINDDNVNLGSVGPSVHSSGQSPPWHRWRALRERSSDRAACRPQSSSLKLEKSSKAIPRPAGRDLPKACQAACLALRLEMPNQASFRFSVPPPLARSQTRDRHGRSGCGDLALVVGHQMLGRKGSTRLDIDAAPDRRHQPIALEDGRNR